jgi:hypothetical protein
MYTYSDEFIAAIAEMIVDGLVGWMFVDTDTN